MRKIFLLQQPTHHEIPLRRSAEFLMNFSSKNYARSTYVRNVVLFSSMSERSFLFFVLWLITRKTCTWTTTRSAAMMLKRVLKIPHMSHQSRSKELINSLLYSKCSYSYPSSLIFQTEPKSCEDWRHNVGVFACVRTAALKRLDLIGFTFDGSRMGLAAFAQLIGGVRREHV